MEVLFNAVRIPVLSYIVIYRRSSLNKIKRIVWSDENTELLKKLWCSDVSMDEIRAAFPHLETNHIYGKAVRSLKLPARKSFLVKNGAWSEAETNLLKSLWCTEISNLVLLESFPSRTLTNINTRGIRYLGLPTRINFSPSLSDTWTDIETKILINLWNTEATVSTLGGTLPNKTKSAINRKAERLGLAPRPLSVKALATSKSNKSRTRDLNIDTITEIADSYKTKSEFRRNDPSAYSSASKLGLLDKVSFVGVTFNYPQTSLLEIIKLLFPLKTVRYNDRKAIRPKEIDVYVVEDKVGFEYDGLNFHSKALDIEQDNIKNKICEDAGIKLYRILEVSKNDPIPYIINQLWQYGFDVSLIDINDIKAKIANHYKSKEDIQNIIDKYESSVAFRKENYNLYVFLKKNNMLDMMNDILPKVVTEEDILYAIRDCKVKQDFFKSNPSLYQRMMKDKVKYNIAFTEYSKVPDKDKHLH